MFCGQCGKQLPEGARFCPSCGAPCASAPTAPEITPKADAASAAAQAEAQNTFSTAAETDAKTAQPSDKLRRKQKKTGEKSGKTRQPLWAWFKSRRLSVKILLCAALVAAVLALGILTNLLWDYTLYGQELPCPDPVDYFSLIETDGGYTSFLDETASLKALRTYQMLLEGEYDADATIAGENGEQHQYVLDIVLNRRSLFGNVRRTLTVIYQDTDGNWDVKGGYRVKFVPVEPYQAAATTGDTAKQQDAATVPDASSDAAEDEATTPTEPEVAARPVLEGAVVPDFKAFCNDCIVEHLVTEDVDYTRYQYYWYYNGKAQTEYIELLRSYGFELRDSYSNGDSEKYVFDYIGTENVGTFDAPYTYRSLDMENVSLFIISLHYGNGDSQFDVLVADGVTYADTGDRTTRELTPYYEDDASASSSGSSAVTSGDLDWNYTGVLDCMTCGGSGDCKKCNGYGFTYTYTYVDGVRTEIKKSCSSCHGSMQCSTCGGSGKR